MKRFDLDALKKSYPNDSYEAMGMEAGIVVPLLVAELEAAHNVIDALNNEITNYTGSDRTDMWLKKYNDEFGDE